MKVIKSIFDKSYIVEAQAIKAGEKEWPQGIPSDVALSRDEATKKFRFMHIERPLVEWDESAEAAQARVEALKNGLAAIHPELVVAEMAMPADVLAEHEAGKPYLVIGGGQYAWACEDADIKVYGNTEVEALEAYKNQLAFEADLKAPAKFQALVADAAAAIEEFDEDELERFADEQRAAERKANASMGLPEAKPRFSSCVRPTKKVWDIADCMAKASRKEVMEECVRQGVAYGTARTQYQAWFKASQEALRGDIRQPYEKGEK